MTNTQAYQRPGTQPPPPLPRAESGETATSPTVKKLNAIIVALSIIDLALIIAIVIVALNVFGGSPQSANTPDTSVTTPSESAQETEPEAVDEEPIEDATGADSFTTPSGNIICTVSSLGVQCGIAKLDKKPAANPDGCEGYVGYVVELRTNGVTTPCVAENDLPGAASQAQEVLDYGDKKTVNNFECTSERTGMKCVDTTSNRGFTLARAGVSTL